MSDLFIEGTITEYQCQNCGESDRDRGFNPPPPLELNCWSCKSKGSMIKTNTIYPENAVEM